MSTQNVFVFWVSPLFYESICRTLKHPNIKFVGETSDYTTVSTDIFEKRPNTIIIEDADKHYSEIVRNYLDSFPWGIKIILLGFKNNKLVVYHHEQRSIAKTEDLEHFSLS